MSSSRSPRTPNRRVVNRRPQIEHIMSGHRAAWSPLWWWPCHDVYRCNRLRYLDTFFSHNNVRQLMQIEEFIHNANPLKILVHLQLLCSQYDLELRFNWRVERSMQSKGQRPINTRFCYIWHRSCMTVCRLLVWASWSTLAPIFRCQGAEVSYML